MLTNERLRFRDEATFEEAVPPADRSRPLEWRRSLNVVTFKATRPTVEYVYSVNEIDHFHELRVDGNGAEAKEQTPPIAPSAQRRQRVCVKVPQGEFRDTIYFTKETEKNSGVFELIRVKDDVRLTLTDLPPSEHRGPFAAGAYAGTAFRADFDPGEDYLGVEVSLPPQHLAEIIGAVGRDESLELHVVIALQSFSYEVDDALREWYHPRDLFIHGGAAPAALVTIRTVHGESIGDTEALVETDEGAPPSIPENPASQPLKIDLSALPGIKSALWAIAVLLLLHLLK